MFEFKLEKSLNAIPNGSSQICHIPEQPAVAYGKLRALFGEPTCETENLEEQYYYCLTGTDEQGNTASIYAYSGASGPAIGGLQDIASTAAAEQLVNMLRDIMPADYAYTGYYLDGPAKVQMGIKDGAPYMEEEELSEEEFAEACKRLFQFGG
ncbi:MAG: hypothetical protein IJA20_05930 [Methanocorpusculum sp.]|nr:hypothetical protein [Oscillospiraceae bacterium]MBQ3570198.1 hypothetical protein [Methanocorpusculum sp.]